MRTHKRGTWAAAAMAAVVAVGMSFAPAQQAHAQEGPYTVCSDIPWPPFEMTNPAGEFFGFDMAVMRSLAVVQGYDIEFQNLAFDSIIPSLRAGKCDVGASGFTITEKRAGVVDFSDPYYLSNQAVVLRSDGKGNMVIALAGRGEAGAVGAQRGTTGAAWVKENLVERGFDVQLKLYETYPLAVLDLVNGRIDAVIQDQPASQSSIAAHPGKLTVAGIIRTYEYFGFPVQKGDPAGLLPRINAGIKQLGLDVVDTAAGQELRVEAGTPWANLSAAYFGPDNAAITAAWDKCKDGILNAESMEDVASYAECMAQAAR